MSDSEPTRGAAAPVIGLTSYLEQAQTGVWDVRASFLPQQYFDGINRSGGIAMLLPPQPVDAAIADRVIDRIDGLVLTGGKDIDAARYRQHPNPANDEPRADRDAWEFALLAAALRRGVPVLGICRGAQVLNVALGGTLHQHLPDVVGHSRHQLGNAVFATIEIAVAPESRLASVVGQAVTAECYHHQAIDEVGEGLVVSARDADGLVEAVELPGDRFVLAVQWHPEERLTEPALFAAVVDAARDHRDADLGVTT